MIMTKFEQWLGCFVFGHNLYVEKKLSDGSRKIGCSKCGKMWAMNDRVQAFLPWDDEFERFYKELDAFIIKGKSRAEEENNHGK
jgi:hypothetical protein